MCIENANIHGKIDLLIGCDIYWDIVTGEIRNKYSGPAAMNSIFGWLISGRTETDRHINEIRTFVYTDCYEKPRYDNEENDPSIQELEKNHQVH